MIRVFTSVASNYVPKARVLAKSVKRLHPDWAFDLILGDTLPSGLDAAREPFDRILMLDDLEIENWKSWAFRHRIVEICTAAKGPAAALLLKQGADKVIYLDPDIAVFNSLDALSRLLDKHPIILTPHQISPDDELEAIIDNEICSLKHGVYNLGFFAVRNHGQGRDFTHWWRDRLLKFCYADIPNGLFTDQRWCDLAPVFFDQLHILRDPGYNVATWNLSQRRLKIGHDGTLLVNDSPLRFYHFTGYDSGDGSVMVQKYGGHSSAVVFELWAWYSNQLKLNGQEHFGTIPWKFNFFDNGTRITDEMRLLYRVRADLQKHFPDPFDTNRADGGFLKWWEHTFKGKARNVA